MGDYKDLIVFQKAFGVVSSQFRAGDLRSEPFDVVEANNILSISPFSQWEDYKDLIVFQKAYELAMDILKSQRNFLLRKNMVSLTKLEDHPDLFALILPK